MKNILITGGTGTVGTAVLEKLQADGAPGRVVIYSRDEETQLQTKRRFPFVEAVRGSMEDLGALTAACRGIDRVIHTAAFKSVPLSESDPRACIATNVTGTGCLIEAAVRCGVKQIVSVSTDMSVEPLSVYGASKLLADKLIVNANGRNGLKTAVVRFGNVLDGKSSIVHFFRKKAEEEGVIPVTHPEMSRFFLFKNECARIIDQIAGESLGGEVFVPKLRSYRIMDLARAVSPEARIEVVGIRPGEKLSETMLSVYEVFRTIETPEFFVVLPAGADQAVYREHYHASPAAEGISLTSGNNPRMETEAGLRVLIK